MILMKKIVLLAVVILVMTAACQKIKNLANINFNIPFSQTVETPAIDGYSYGVPLPGGGATLPFPSVSVATNAQQLFDKYHGSSKNLVDAHINNIDLQIVSAGQNFDLLDTIQLFLSTETLPEILVAYQYNIPKGQTRVDLTIVPGKNLKNYVVQDSVRLRLNAHINALPRPGTQILAEGVFRVTANPL